MTDDLVPRRPRTVVLVAVVSGVLLGAIDLLLQKILPYPWANLANSSAVWAVGAFTIGAWARAGRWSPPVAGTILLLVAVETYYLTATLVQHDDISNLWNPSTLVWLAFGVLAGAVFGTVGAWSRGANRWLRLVGTALSGAVLLAESMTLGYGLRTVADSALRVDRIQTVIIEAVLGLALPLLIGRTWRERLTALAAGVPLGLLGFGAFLAGGFRG